jgi:hypothetical protein
MANDKNGLAVGDENESTVCCVRMLSDDVDISNDDRVAVC